MATKKRSLTTYRKKRHFGRSAEPRGVVKKSRSKKPIFVVHEHSARSHHFDFRLEMDGVLKSWAVPKGITSVLGEKHLAIPTEDHPLSYARFEGVIPKGEYGAGTVMVWDKGTYKNLKEKDAISMGESLKKGRFELRLEGKKLRGGYALIRTKRRETGESFWLMLKMDDAYANKPIKNKDVSALTGRSMKEIGKEIGERD